MLRSKAQRLILSSQYLILATIFTGCPQLDSIGWVYNAPGDQTGYRIFGANSGDLVVAGIQPLGNGRIGVPYVRFGANGSVVADGLIPDLRNPPGNILKPTATLLSNGDLLLTGTTAQNPPDGNYRLRVLRISPSGQTLWEFSYGDTELTPKVAAENSLGNILVAGNHTTYGGTQRDVFFLLLSADGAIVAFNQLETLEDESNFSVLVDGMSVGSSFVLSGWSITQVGRDDYENTISVIKLDENAAVTSWARNTGLYNRSIGIEPNDGGYAIIASSDTSVQLIKTNATGEILSVRDDIFSRANPDERSGAKDFIVDTSGDIVMVGEGTTIHYIAEFFPQLSIRPFIAKLTPDGDQIWQTSIDARGVIINGVTETADGGYATTGAAPGAGGDVLLNVIRFDHNGNVIN